MGKNDKQIYEAIGQRMKKIQILYHKTDQEMANDFHITVDQYRNYVHGRSPISTNAVLILRDKFNVDMNYLFYGDDSSGMFVEYNPDNPDGSSLEKKNISKYLARLSAEDMADMLLNLQKKPLIDFLVELCPSDEE